ncbi:hypothetical protein SAMN05444170_0051 [Bradyrhizobium erythrophlei]|uniref:Uncharacterized protein n=1 Tax=Bradyrhizobium erythrophlei TaxID=1437360 RepID=A0A1M7SQT3_9BRAD|nr:hypothetical protein SAMN05444170_0051 [Bradyrhizobium erythrophlei]
MREQKITLGGLRGAGVIELLVYCSDYKTIIRVMIAMKPKRQS